MIFFNGQTRVGIDLSDYKVRLIALTGTRKPSIRTFCEIDIPTGTINEGAIQKTEVVVQLLKTLARHCKGLHWHDRTVRVGIPEQQSFITTVSLDSNHKGDNIDQVLEVIPFKKEELYYDVHEHRTRQAMSIAAARKAFVDQYLQIFSAANFHVVALYSEAEAMATALLDKTTSTTAGIIIIDLGRARTTVIFCCKGLVYFTTSYPSVLTGDTLNQGNFLAVTQQAMAFYGQHYAQYATLQQLVLCGSGAYQPNLATTTQTACAITTVLGNPLQHIRSNHFTKKLNRPLTFTTAIGLVLYA
ncbi:MAG: pilus assembly protein PilM [Candidatus Kerfeldbacteria bacterium]|nr:pilus assembly protein PilM [Candidatus Kerfeldbacteria bacterium]